MDGLEATGSLNPDWNANLDQVQERKALEPGFAWSTRIHPTRGGNAGRDRRLFDPISSRKTRRGRIANGGTLCWPGCFPSKGEHIPRAFQYGNAEAEGFLDGDASASGQVLMDKIMPTFVDQAGEPVLTVRSACLNPPGTESAGSAERKKRIATRPDKTMQPHK